MKKPIIGITPLVDIEKASYWMLPGYMQGLEAAGAVPIMLPLLPDSAGITELAGICDGFLFAGGQDVSPSLYGETARPACGELCPERDSFEAALFQAALHHNKPVLGICRGIQLINVLLGGTLYQDLPTEHPSETPHRMAPPYDRAAHSVAVIPGSPLAALLGAREIGVNSCHHQAIKSLAPALRAMARAQDGLVEAACLPIKDFVWAVQWHPEFSFTSDENSQKLFGAFVAAAAKA